MLETARILGSFSAVLLLAAVAAWAKLLRGPLLQPIDRRAAWDRGEAGLASKLLVWAAGLSTAAAILAVTAWIAP